MGGCAAISGDAQLQQIVHIIPAADSKNRHASGVVIDVIGEPELGCRDFYLVGIWHAMQSVFGNTGMCQALFLKFLLEAPPDRNIQLAPLPFRLGVDGQLITHQA